MLTHEDRPTPESTADTRPATRRLVDRLSGWAVAGLFVAAPAVILAAVVLAPFLIFAAVVGVAGTLVRYAVRRDWKALRHVAAGAGLVVAGYLTARIAAHTGVHTLDSATADWRARSSDLSASGDYLRAAFTMLAAFVVWMGYLTGLLASTVVFGYALVRPYRSRIAPAVVLAGCGLVGLLSGFVR